MTDFEVTSLERVSESEESRFRSFVPICLYSKYLRNRANLRKVISGLEQHCPTMILIADRIQAINYQLKLGCSRSEALRRANSYGSELRLMADKVASESKASCVYSWADLSGSREYWKCARRVLTVLRGDENFQECVSGFISQGLSARGFRASEANIRLERKYVLNELCMTVYLVKVLGCSIHFWEDLPAKSAFDPIGDMCEHRPKALDVVFNARHRLSRVTASELGILLEEQI